MSFLAVILRAKQIALEEKNNLAKKGGESVLLHALVLSCFLMITVLDAEFGIHDFIM